MENQANVVVDIGRVANDGESESGSSDGEVVEEVVRLPRGRAQPPRAVPPLEMDLDMWLNMVDVKTPFLVDLEIESMKKIILANKRYSQTCPRQLLRSMQQFVLEEHLDIMCSEADEEMEKFMLLERDDFISAMLKMEMIDEKLAKMEKSDHSYRPKINM